MKHELTDSQVLFCIIFSLQNNLNLYRIEEKKGLLGKIAYQKLILNNVKYKNPFFYDDSEFDGQNYNFDSIIKLINYSLFMSFPCDRLHKPDWHQRPIDIIQRLKLTGSYPSWLLDLSEYIFDKTKSSSKIIFPEKINNKVLMYKFLNK